VSRPVADDGYHKIKAIKLTGHVDVEKQQDDPTLCLDDHQCFLDAASPRATRPSTANGPCKASFAVIYAATASWFCNVASTSGYLFLHTALAHDYPAETFLKVVKL
jgi:hypothetical protein